jgi:hypothetical protein
LIDASSLKPMRDEGQQAFTTALSVMKTLAFTRVSVITASHLTKLQIMRIATAAGMAPKIQFV